MFYGNYASLIKDNPSLILFDWNDTLVGTEKTPLSFGNKDEPFHGAVEFLEHIRSLGIKTAIISNSIVLYVRERAAYQNVRKLDCLCKLFDLIVGTCDIKAVYEVNKPAIKPSINCHRNESGKIYCEKNQEDKECAYFIKPNASVGEAILDHFGGREKHPNVWMVGDEKSDIQFALNSNFIPIGSQNTYAISQHSTLNFNNYPDFFQWPVNRIDN